MINCRGTLLPSWTQHRLRMRNRKLIHLATLFRRLVGITLRENCGSEKLGAELDRQQWASGVKAPNPLKSLNELCLFSIFVRASLKRHELGTGVAQTVRECATRRFCHSPHPLVFPSAPSR